MSCAVAESQQKAASSHSTREAADKDLIVQMRVPRQQQKNPEGVCELQSVRGCSWLLSFSGVGLALDKRSFNYLRDTECQPKQL